MPGPALTSDMQTSTAEYATIVNEIVAAASEFVEAMLKEEHVNAKPNESNNILKTKLLSRWALKFKSMQDPANVSKVNQELHVLNDNGEFPCPRRLIKALGVTMIQLANSRGQWGCTSHLCPGQGLERPLRMSSLLPTQRILPLFSSPCWSFGD